MSETLYRIRRFYQQWPGGTVIRRGLTLAAAQTHCQDPETSSRTCTGAEGKDHTRRYGPWFDGYEEEN